MSDKTIYDKLILINQETDKIKTMLVNSKQLTAEEATLENIPPAIQTLIEAGGGSVEANPYEQIYMQRTSNETNMKGLFAYCTNSELDLTKLDTSKVTDMSYMFNDCTSQININGWDTSKVTKTDYMFQKFTNNNKYLDLSVLDFSNVTSASGMFDSCNIDYVDIRNTNLNLAKLKELPFRSVKGTVLDLSNYDITGLTSTYYLGYFCYCPTIDLTNWKTTEVTNMKQTFYYGSSIEKIIMPDWDMTNVTTANATNFFYNCSKLNYIDLSRSNDDTIAKIASLAPAKTLAAYGQILIPVNSSQAAIDALVTKYWKPVGPRIDITSCEIITELDEIKPGKTTKFYYGNSTPWYGNDIGVEYASSDESIATVNGNIITSTGIEGTTEITARIADTGEVISEPKILVVSEIDNYPNVIKARFSNNASSSTNLINVNGTSIKKSAFNYNDIADIYTYDAGTPITSFSINSTTYFKELVKINTSNVTTMNSMFYNCNNLTSLDVSNFDTSNVTTMYRMFRDCNQLTSIDVSNFDTSNVTNMYEMFYYCTSLTSVDVSNFNTSNVTDMRYMFSNCNQLTSLDLSNWDTSEVTNMYYMFTNCTSLHTLRLDNCNNATISKILNSYGFPTGAIEGATRKIYCKEENAAGLTPPTNWVFEYIE